MHIFKKSNIHHHVRIHEYDVGNSERFYKYRPYREKVNFVISVTIKVNWVE